MKVEFNSIKECLDINKLSQLKIISLEDYGRDYQEKIDFHPGAHQIEVIVASENTFASISDFLMHIMSMQYADRINYNLPVNFFNRSYSLSEMSKDQFKLYADSYFEGFFDHLYPISPNIDLWKIQFNISDYEVGYKIKMTGTEQVLVCKTAKYYLYLLSQSID